MSSAVLESETTTSVRKLHVALELSSKKWVLAFSDGSARPPRVKEVDGNDRDAVQRAIATMRRAYKLSAAAPVVSVYEAGRDGFWVHRWLDSVGVANWVVEPSTVSEKSKGRRPKTDKLDAKKLLSQLVRVARGEQDVWRAVRTPSEAEEDSRRRARERHTLVTERTRVTNRVRSLLVLHGVRVDRIDKITPTHLESLSRWDGTPLPPNAKCEITRCLELLTLVRGHLAAIEQEFKAEAKRAAQTSKNSERNDAPSALAKLHALLALKGVGLRSANVLVGEFGWREFRNGRQVGALAGLTGTPDDSGSRVRDRGISKAGNRRVRGVMIELAWLWIRHQKASAITQWYERQIAAGQRKRSKRVAIVAVARRLLVALWRYWNNGVVPTGAAMKAA